MVTVVVLLLAWCALSLPLGIVVGRLLGRTPSATTEPALPSVPLVAPLHSGV